MATRRLSRTGGPAHGICRRAMAVAVATSFVLAACSNDDPSSGSTLPTLPSGTSGSNTTTPTTDGPIEPGEDEDVEAPRALTVGLSEGQPQAAPPEAVPVVSGDPLDQAAIDAIVARLPPFSGGAAKPQPFNWPAQTLPPPRTGATVDVPFPPDDSVPAPDVPTGPLQVLRYQPEGDVAIAPYVSITFDQPMVELGTLAQLDVTDVPATITPAIPGTWQWIGTRTLRFDHDSDAIDRLPMATTYTVEVPAGTTSVTGGALAAAVSWQFTTPPATVQSFQPTGNSLPLAPVFVATFDQLIDPDAVLASITLEADGQPVAIRLASKAEIDADDAARQITTSAADGRWIAFQPVDPLAADTPIEIAIGPGTPSAEGDAVSAQAKTYTGRTYAALRVLRIECGYDRDCPPGTDINVTLSNPLDPEQFDPAWVTVEPAIAGMIVSSWGDIVNVRGATAARTTYTVTLSKDTTDVFGQTLGTDASDTIEVGSAPPTLSRFEGFLTTLDPLVDKPGLSVFTVNHDELRVRVFDVAPSDWADYQKWQYEELYDYDDPDDVDPDWPELIDTVVPVDGDEDRLTETIVDLTGPLSGSDGHLVVLVQPTQAFRQTDETFWANMPQATWVQQTTIGLDAFSDNDEILAWATDLRSGAPLAGVSVQPLGSGNATPNGASTDQQGLATIDLTSNAFDALVATLGDDSAILPADQYGGSWAAWDRDDEVRWYVFDDRQVYRPDETVSMKGWIRRLTVSADGQLALVGTGATVNYSAHDAQGNVIAEGSTDVNALGGFDLTFDVPVEANLGYAWVDLSLDGVSFTTNGFYTHGYQIQEFRRPEFEVTTHAETSGPYVSAHPATVAVNASYYAGGPLPGAPVDWQVTTSAASYSPPGWDDFSFGEWTPWWIAGDSGYYPGAYRGDFDCCFPQQPSKVESFAGTTGADGSHYLQIGFGSPDGTRPDLPVTVSAQATVQDVNRQAWSSATSLLVHPGQLYVGLRSETTFVREGEPIDVEAIVTDIDGGVVGGRPVRLTASRLEWKTVNGEWTEVPVDPQTCDVTSADEPVSCSFETTVGGTYEIVTTVTDDEGGTSRTELTRWVSGGDARPNRSVDQETVTVVPDAREYAPGDTARVLVASPFPTGEGLATISRNGITSTVRFTLADGSAVVEIPLAGSDIPGVDVTIEVVGTSQRLADDGSPAAGAPPRPAFAAGSIRLPISLASRTLTVDATPPDPQLEPGSTTQLDVTVTDDDGQAVEGAEFAVVVVDEAVLALSNYQLQDPLGAFYGDLGGYVQARYARDSIVLADPASAQGSPGGDGDESASTEAPADMEAPTSAPAATVPASEDSGAGDNASRSGGSKALPDGSTPVPIDVRTDFDALAVFEPEVMTDADGRAVVEVPLPDNLTRYRVMVVAVDGPDRFGSTESNITARLPLMVRPSAPRFLNFGDVFELPVIVQNQTGAAMDVDVTLEVANLAIVDPGSADANPASAAGVRVSVPANERIEVRFPVSAVEAGTASFRVAAASADAADAATVDVPVYTPATSEAFATYGVIDDGSIQQPLLAPVDVIPQFGGLEVTTSSTSLQALTDAVIYLSEYPYESSDAMASRILAIVALRDVLEAFDAEGVPTPAEMEEAVANDIERLVDLQNDDGGFPYWQRYRKSEPYNSIQATHALVEAKAAGYSVPQPTLDAALAYLGSIENHFEPEYGEQVRDTLSSYALHVRALSGDRDTEKAERLYDRRGDALQLDALAWLWPVVNDAAIVDEIERTIANSAVETAGAANFTTSYSDDAYVLLHSDRRTDGIVLDALIAEQPDSDLIPKVVVGLLGHQTKGRWDNVQENSFILLALKRYFDTYESVDPDFVARVWLGEQFAGESAYVGRSTDRDRISVPTGELISAGDTDIVLAKDGAGRLYYRLGLRYAPADLQLDPLDRGFVVERTYEAVEDPSDVTRDPDGTWHIKPGALVRVRLSLVADSQRTHVALIDPLPAGLEILNTALAVTPEVLPDTPTSGGGDSSDVPADAAAPYSWWYWTWFDHENARDDRAEAFSSWLPAGTYEYEYLARATTPGTFVVPPTRAEEMYAPETFGRAATDTVVIAGS